MLKAVCFQRHFLMASLNALAEFFLHHEGISNRYGYIIDTNMSTEKYHSTPETQTDESYTHPEDLEHFAQHEAIERKEAEREAKFQGLSVEEVLKAQEQAAVAAASAAASASAEAAAAATATPSTKPVVRVPPPEKQEPAAKYKGAKGEGEKKGEWGTGEGGYKSPTDPSDKMRCVKATSIFFLS